MTDGPPIPLFTGGELALADTVILLMKVMSMHGIIDEAGIVAVFADLERRYRGQDLHCAAAMAEYLRKHTVEADHQVRAGSGGEAVKSPGGPV
jgi:hypothetical protein